MTCPHSEKTCVNRHDCERCKVPEAYGYFLVWKRGKAEWQQRFILDADRAALIRHYDIEICRAQTLRAAVERLPGKEEYEGGDVNNLKPCPFCGGNGKSGG